MADVETTRLVGGRYRLDRPLGRGGMAAVWAGRDLRLRRPVAIKVLRADLADLDEARARFESEARAAARLVHPHIVAIFDTGEAHGLPFIVMEMLSGKTLHDQVRDGPLPAPAVRTLGVQVLDALTAAHDAGIVHRDVKPGNVLQAGPESWKLADFGIARIMAADSDLTSTGLVPGTPAYLAPERLRGASASPSTDLYSVGVMLSVALTGQHPDCDGASRPSPDETLGAGTAWRRDRRGPEPNVELVRVIRRAMDADPRRRFSSAPTMRAALLATDRIPHPNDQATTQPVGLIPQREAPSATHVLTPGPRPLRAPRRVHRRSLLAVAAAAAVVASVFTLVLVLTAQGPSAPATPVISTTTTARPVAGLPAPLAAALRELDTQTRP